jgi:hypothetical protein
MVMKELDNHGIKRKRRGKKTTCIEVGVDRDG